MAKKTNLYEFKIIDERTDEHLVGAYKLLRLILDENLRYDPITREDIVSNGTYRDKSTLSGIAISRTPSENEVYLEVISEKNKKDQTMKNLERNVLPDFCKIVEVPKEAQHGRRKI